MPDAILSNPNETPSDETHYIIFSPEIIEKWR
jgi:hypothetical protein